MHDRYQPYKTAHLLFTGRKVVALAMFVRVCMYFEIITKIPCTKQMSRITFAHVGGHIVVPQDVTLGKPKFSSVSTYSLLVNS
jgi:hypothetical protein